jgi:hypothetical protein
MSVRVPNSMTRAAADTPTHGRLRIPRALFAETFSRLRVCGRGRAECQVLWIGPWADPTVVTEIVHPAHQADFDGFKLEDTWINGFWCQLAARQMGIRAQVHTHPGAAFHSPTDDAFPISHLPGFLSLVIPSFALGPVSLADSYLAELGPDGRFHERDPAKRLTLL